MAEATRQPIFAIAALMAVIGCRDEKKTPDPGPASAMTSAKMAPAAPPSAPPPASAAKPIAPDVPYECEPLRPVPSPTCESPPSHIVKLHELGRAFLSAAHDSPNGATCREAKETVALALTEGPSSLETRTRIVANNAALRIFARADRCKGMSLGASAARLLEKTRLEPSELGSDEPFDDLEDWIGPRGTWQDRLTRHVPLFHEEVEHATRAFRPVRTPKIAAIFSQLVAVDTEWKARVTSVVGRVELRRGFVPGASACVAHLSVERVECSAGRLEPAELEEPPPKTHFFVKHDAGVTGCNSCHHPGAMRSPKDDLFGDLSPIPPGDAHLEKRREALLGAADDLVQRVQKELR